MKCLSFIRNHIGTFTLFCSLFVSFFVSSLFVLNSYAIADFVLTIDSSFDFSQSSNRYICGPGTNRNCTDWSYIVFEFSGQSFSSNNTVEVRQGTFYTYLYPYYNLYMIQSLQNMSDFSPYQFSNFSSFLTTGSLTITLTDTLPGSSITPATINISSNGTYDVTNYTSAEVDVVSTTPYDSKLDEIIKAIYVCAGTILVIYFFYCIYRLIIKNSGVK